MRGAAANGHRKAIAMSDRLPEGNFEERISKLEAAGKVTLEAHIRRVNSLNDQLDELEAARDSLDMLLTQATSRIKELEAELDDYKSRLERVVRSSSQTDVRNGGRIKELEADCKKLANDVVTLLVTKMDLEAENERLRLAIEFCSGSCNHAWTWRSGIS